jgi:hypothetical protein
VSEIWAGVDIGKEYHHCAVINADGVRLLSRRVLNDGTELLQLIGDILAISTDVLWVVDLNHDGAALLIDLLLGHDQSVAYLTGLAVHRALVGYRGEGKTDAKGAFVIADQVRVRRDLGLLGPGDEIAVDLRILTTRRLDMAFDRTRRINRLRARLLEIFPALERSLDLVNKGPVMLLTGCQTPAAIRRAGAQRPVSRCCRQWARPRRVSSISSTATGPGAAAATSCPAARKASITVGQDSRRSRAACMTVAPASRTRGPAVWRSRAVIRARAGAWLTCSVNDRREHAGSLQYQRRLRHTSSTPRSPHGRSRGRVTAQPFALVASTPHSGQARPLISRDRVHPSGALLKPLHAHGGQAVQIEQQPRIGIVVQDRGLS